MSLKAFHIFFIAVSTILAFGFGGWAVYVYAVGASSWPFLIMGVCSLAAGGVLVYYGINVARKLREM